jgi:hypothetical protein
MTHGFDSRSSNTAGGEIGAGPIALTVTHASGDRLPLMLGHQMRVHNLAMCSISVMQHFIDSGRHRLVEMQSWLSEPNTSRPWLVPEGSKSFIIHYLFKPS